MKSLLKKIVVFMLTLEARAVLKKYKPKLIAITGSVGKTSTKDAVYDVLKTSFFVRKSEKSYNSEIGIPLTILGITNAWGNPFLWVKNLLSGLALIVLPSHYPQWLVVEVGLDKPGDVKRATRLFSPDILIYTRFADVPVHVENFSSPEALFAEKALLIDVLKQEGLLVLNQDDERILALKQRSRSMVVTFGFDEKAMVRASHDETEYDKEGNPLGAIFKINFDGSAVPIRLSNVFGKQYMYAALAAVAVGAYLKVNMITMVEALALFKTPPGRTKLLPAIKGAFIIDDTYNSSPVAAEAALQTLSQWSRDGKKIAVLGDMLELGKYAVEEHRRIGKVAGAAADMLLCVGARAQFIAEGALDGGMSEKNIFQFNDAREAGKFLESKLGKGDVVLIKGSQSMRMERAVEEIMLHPEDKAKLLVRQEEEWQRR